MNNIKVLGIDLAKNVFELHGTDSKGKCLLRKTLTREKLKEFIAKLTPVVIGMEACGGAHYWARYCKQFGHEVRMMSPQFVKPYVKSNKTDRNDAEAIAEACTRPNMRFVATKSAGQQDVLAIHRARELLVGQKVALSNHIRGILLEYGITLPQGLRSVRNVCTYIDESADKLSDIMTHMVESLREHFVAVEAKIKEYEQILLQLSADSALCQEIEKIPGIGPITSTAIIATIGDASVFKKGREVAAWLGLVPKQNSSGGKVRIGGISKRGDAYVRKLLVHGARSVIRFAENKVDKVSKWATNLKARSCYNKAAVALANKNARVIWAIMNSGEAYKTPKPVVV